ncbi:VOC family protein [Bacillus sp. NPDC077027]|uniref:VOC family protein n=1 Tax=Bacillus sp. NPDC077027 TaxID=3390548 RepID=UPI003CFCBE7A
MQIQSVATIEIPVKDIARASSWYQKHLGMNVMHQSDEDAMLNFQTDTAPSFYLVKTEDDKRLHFLNTSKGIRHGVIDVYVEDLKGFHQFLAEHGVQTTDIHILAAPDMGGFGFEDIDGNALGATNMK